ncbi:copper amine oxidase N-terminal domain-containing protein [Cohnella cholangitidis]|uniref:copper amine oxidase N-terminal domain-containing protein n=1 Tax=Cohnella cholangitidis TaxID=2598458 RepID=UPI0015FDD9D3|nr:copper amine oxidase N-terminal domain-containing protein [Cohnella cholangitidis]
MGKIAFKALLGFGILIGTISSATVHAEEAAPGATKEEIIVKVNDPNAWINGKKVTLQAPPTTINHQTVVPMRFISDSIGAKLKWEKIGQKITISYGDKVIELTVGQKQAKVNGAAVQLNQPAVILNGTTMVPMRFILQSLQLDFQYDKATQEIRIFPKGGQKVEEEAAGAEKESPVQEEVKETPEKQPLEKPTVDFLSFPPSTAMSHLDKMKVHATSSIAAANNGQVYILEKDPNKGYQVKKYDPNAAGKFTVIASIDQRFNFEYTLKNNNKGSFVYSEFVPRRLFYNEATDSLYLLGESAESKSPVRMRTVAYSIFPEVKMVAYQINTQGYYNLEDNFFASLDDETFYYGDPHSQMIYSSAKGQALGVADSSRTADKTRLFSTVRDGAIYFYDTKGGKIFKWNGKAVEKVAEVALDVESIQNVTASNGYFYVLDNKKTVHRVNLNGESSLYSNLGDVTYHPGIHGLPDTSNWPVTSEEQLKLDPYKLLMSIGDDGNLIVYDFGILKRINIYP